MHKRIWITALAITLAVAGGWWYRQRTTVTATNLNHALHSVNALYRNDAHVLPAVDLTATKVAHAKAALAAINAEQLSAKQEADWHAAVDDVAAAAKMLTVTQATKAPLAATPDYAQQAQAALAAYQALSRDKPLFTQVYQQPIADLHTNKAAVEAVNTLETATAVTTQAIADTKAAVAKVTSTPDTAAFDQEAQAVVDSATAKLPESIADYNDTVTPPVETSTPETTTSEQPVADTARIESEAPDTSNNAEASSAPATPTAEATSSSHTEASAESSAATVPTADATATSASGESPVSEAN